MMALCDRRRCHVASAYVFWGLVLLGAHAARAFMLKAALRLKLTRGSGAARLTREAVPWGHGRAHTQHCGWVAPGTGSGPMSVMWARAHSDVTWSYMGESYRKRGKTVRWFSSNDGSEGAEWSGGGGKPSPPANASSPWASVEASRLTKDQAEVELAYLGPKLLYHDWVYYNGDGTETDAIPDAVFDVLERRQRDIEERFPGLTRPDSRSRRVGVAPSAPTASLGDSGVPRSGGGLKPASPHRVPMLSLDNALTREALEAFMLRIARTLDKEEQEEKVASSANCGITMVGEPKLDGMSLSLTYEDGRLIQVATRGDGRRGDDVTHNGRRLHSIPQAVTAAPLNRGVWEVRGEVFMPPRVLPEINEQRAARGLPPFANARNAVAGSMRLLPGRDGAEVFEVGARQEGSFVFVAYDLVREGHQQGLSASSQEEHSNSALDTHTGVMAMLRGAGFQVPNPTEAFAMHWVPPGSNSEGTDPNAEPSTTGAAAMHGWLKDMEDRRCDLPYDADGVVFKVDSLPLRDVLGTTSRAPRWAIAAKFSSLKGTTRVVDIVVSVGRTGALTPVAVLEPLTLGGVVVSRASLHNAAYVDDLDLRIGDQVIVERAGDVIPQVVAVAPKGGPEDAVASMERQEPWRMPNLCPVCSSIVERVDSRGVPIPQVVEEAARAVDNGTGAASASASKHHRCTGGIHCAAQAVEALAHFVSRKALDIEGLGPRRLRELYEKGAVRTLPDVLRLGQWNAEAATATSVEDVVEDDSGEHPARVPLEQWDGWGDLSVSKLLGEITRRRETPLGLARFVYALGIPGVGLNTAQLLAKEFRSAEVLWGAMQAAAGEGVAAPADSDDEEGDHPRACASPATNRFLAVLGVGQVTVDAIRAFTQDDRNEQMVTDLLALLTVEDDETPEVLLDPDGSGERRPRPLQGLTIVFTGELASMKRDEARQLVERLGGKSPAAMSAKTTHLVVGNGAGGKKLEKAAAQGTTVLPEQEFPGLLESLSSASARGEGEGS